MKVEKDYEDFLRSLNKNRVRYCIVGAYAVAFYSRPRYTKDLDILVEPAVENGKKIIKALKEFGFESLKLSEKDFTKKGTMIQLGYEPLRIDILTSIQGMNFEEVWKRKKVGRYGKHKVNFIGMGDLAKNKKMSNRKQDQADLEVLLRSKKATKR